MNVEHVLGFPHVFFSSLCTRLPKKKPHQRKEKEEKNTPIFPSFPHVYLRKNLTKDMQDVFEVQDIKVAKKPSEMVMEEME
jgi:hypothetical protein